MNKICTRHIFATRHLLYEWCFFYRNNKSLCTTTSHICFISIYVAPTTLYSSCRYIIIIIINAIVVPGSWLIAIVLVTIQKNCLNLTGKNYTFFYMWDDTMDTDYFSIYISCFLVGYLIYNHQQKCKDVSNRLDFISSCILQLPHFEHRLSTRFHHLLRRSGS